MVVSAGSINSPQLLELSGIGQPERLRRLGIEVRHALPGVGENLRDHYAPRTRWAVGARGMTFNDRGRGLGLVRQALRYALTGKGLLGMVAAPIRAFVRSRDGLEAPDLLLGLGPDADRARPDGPEDLAPVRHDLLRPSDAPGEQGHIHITSADPRTPPAISFNFLSAPLDARADRCARSASPAPS